MSELDQPGKQLLALLVERLPKAIPEKPETFITYKDAHDRLGLSLQGQTYGLSLKHQGLVSLADWTAAKGLPAITGLIVSGDDRMPGQGYFNLFGRTEDDFAWWADQIQKSKTYDWSPFLPLAKQPPTPIAPDAVKPPERVEPRIYRVLRDTQMALRVKALHNHECQVCGTTITLPDGRRYAEAHHIQPLGAPHNGPDVAGNLICLCPNHHAEFDYGVRPLRVDTLRQVPGHQVAELYVTYHNDLIYKPRRQ
ncbi:HNH endonuclease [Labrys neptuniae]|uniref:HNH endonuclease n=1 Tax=Labrys neptuniae TaxID=376174 RepID=UPI002891769E|nr:HNH endonuclease [Labrys neptuniae]MDT3379632.1 HNH endonuclease [Labrys neptuniae]